jgi:hypothetical protein
MAGCIARPWANTLSLRLLHSPELVLRILGMSRPSVLIQKFESLQIRIAAPDLRWTVRGSRMARTMAELVLSEAERTKLKELSSRGNAL